MGGAVINPEIGQAVQSSHTDYETHAAMPDIRQQTASLAYQIWEWGGRQPNVAVENWLAAEQVLLSSVSAARQVYAKTTAGPEIENSIRQISYQLWEAAACQYGLALDTWIAAQGLMLSAFWAVTQRASRRNDFLARIRSEDRKDELWMNCLEPEKAMEAMIKAMGDAFPSELITSELITGVRPELITELIKAKAWGAAFPPGSITKVLIASKDYAGSPPRATDEVGELIHLLARLNAEREGGPKNPEVPVTISGEAPKEVRKGDIARVDVRIERSEAAHPFAGARVAADIAPDQKIRIFVSARQPWLEVLPPQFQEIDPPEVGQPVQIAFQIRPQAVDKFDIVIHFRQGGTEVGHLSFQIQAVEVEPARERTGARTAAAPRDLADDDVLDLLIQEYHHEGGGIGYRYLLTYENVGMHHQEFLTPSPFKDRGGTLFESTSKYVFSIYEDVTRQLTTRSEAQSLQRHIGYIGEDMGRQLFSKEFISSFWWPNRARVRAVLVESWEGLIP
jgi:hypothetical protein